MNKKEVILLMFYPEVNFPSYSPYIIKAFQEGKSKDILNKHLYKFREHTDNEAFHFLMGLCMLNMGYYEEAHAAFQKTQKVAKGSHKGDVFDALVMLMAQRDKEASDKVLNISMDSLTVNEIVTVMSIKTELGLTVSAELQKVLNTQFRSEADRRVLSLFAFKYSGYDDAASYMAKSLAAYLFQDFATYMYVIKEIYKLHMIEDVDYLLSNIHMPTIAGNPDKFLDYINTCYACGYYNRMNKHLRKQLFQYATEKQDEKALANAWKNNLSHLYCMEYDRLEADGNHDLDCKHIIEKLKKLKYKSEQTLLYITTYDFNHFCKDNQKSIKENLEQLIQMNQTNVRYRKLYCDLLTISGYLHQSDEVTKGTIAMRKRLETEEFALVYSFRSFYMPKQCMMKYMPVHKHNEGKDCPVCFGSGFQPVIRAIGAGHSSSHIFTDNMESHVIEPNEAMLKDLVNWQPMNVPGPIIAKYLMSLGAYMSAREYPDVLVAGQTYLYLKLKPEAEKRLLKEGYSMLQINPVAVAIDEKGRANIGNGKKITDIPVSASDFTLEIIHAISSQHELDNTPSMPVPEQYCLEKSDKIRQNDYFS